jgi:polyribonucleotide nucleotidyltransferase
MKRLPQALLTRRRILRHASTLVSTQFEGRELVLEVGRVGPIADSVVVARYGGTTVLSSAVASPANAASPAGGGLPLQVEFRERSSAYGLIPDGAGRREPNMRESEVLAARVIDRSLRPLFYKGYALETQIINTVMSVDSDCDPVVLSILASSAALHCGPIPWAGPAAAVRVGLIQPLVNRSAWAASPNQTYAPLELAINPTTSLLSSRGVLDLLYSGTDAPERLDGQGTPSVDEMFVEGGVPAFCSGRALMIEAEGRQVNEREIIRALRAAQNALMPALRLQRELREQSGSRPKKKVDLLIPSPELIEAAQNAIHKEAMDAFRVPRDKKSDRGRMQGMLQSKCKSSLLSSYPNEDPSRISIAADMAIRAAMRAVVVEAATTSSKINKAVNTEQTSLTTSSELTLSGPTAVDSMSLDQPRFFTPPCDAESCRVDGRSTTSVRRVLAQVDFLPGSSVHGSALFSRGDTQVIATVTLGPLDLAMEQVPFVTRSRSGMGIVDATSPALLSSSATESESETNDSGNSALGVGEPKSKRFFLHYDFPPYATNEVAKMGVANRRMIGHGVLAEKALRMVMPSSSSFPYAVRVTSETSGSDGSSSMATTCGATLALLDAGVPLVAPVAGVSIGCFTPAEEPGGRVMKQGDSYTLLTDIFGLEDYIGDMDFKVAGTSRGITAMQLDVKPAGLPLEVLEQALLRAKSGRLHILDRMRMQAGLGPGPSLQPRQSLKQSAPKLEVLELPAELRPKLIGPGGSNLAKTERLSGAKLMLAGEDGSRLFIYSSSLEAISTARSLIFAVVHEHLRVVGSPLMANLQPRETLPELTVGMPINAVVIKVSEFGVTLGMKSPPFRGLEASGGGVVEVGWMHLSEFARHRSHKVTDYLEDEDEVTVMVCDVDARGRGKFSVKALLPPGDTNVEKHIVRKGLGSAKRAAAAASEALAAQAAQVTAIPAGPIMKHEEQKEKSKSSTKAAPLKESTNETTPTLRAGQTVTATVMRVVNNAAWLSLNGKEAGYLPAQDLSPDIKQCVKILETLAAGDQIKATVVREGSGKGKPTRFSLKALILQQQQQGGGVVSEKGKNTKNGSAPSIPITQALIESFITYSPRNTSPSISTSVSSSTSTSSSSSLSSSSSSSPSSVSNNASASTKKPATSKQSTPSATPTTNKQLSGQGLNSGIKKEQTPSSPLSSSSTHGSSESTVGISNSSPLLPKFAVIPSTVSVNWTSFSYLKDAAAQAAQTQKETFLRLGILKPSEDVPSLVEGKSTSSS